MQKDSHEENPRLVAFIREAECIGCTKCIDACPVDAILGSAKHMHTVIAAECIGCKLCVSPCPIDCIDMITLPSLQQNSMERKCYTEHVKNRFRARKKRLIQKTQETISKNVTERKKYIADAILRAQAKRNNAR